MAMCSACAAISAFCASLKPVVPITALTPSSRHTARCASVPSGRVKSISTCASREPGAQVGGDEHAAAGGRGRRAASWPMRRAAGDVERAGQHAVVGAHDRLDQHAGPCGPEAPATAMRSGRPALGARLRAAGRCAHRRADAARRRRRARGGGTGKALICPRRQLQRRRVARGLEGVDRGDEVALARQVAAGVQCSSGFRRRTAPRRGAAAARRPGGGS